MKQKIRRSIPMLRTFSVLFLLGCDHVVDIQESTTLKSVPATGIEKITVKDSEGNIVYDLNDNNLIENAEQISNNGITITKTSYLYDNTSRITEVYVQSDDPLVPSGVYTQSYDNGDVKGRSSNNGEKQIYFEANGEYGINRLIQRDANGNVVITSNSEILN